MYESGTGKVILPKFDGAPKSFMIWYTRFMAYASVMKFAEAVRKTKDPNLPAKEGDAIDESTDDGKKKAAALKRNAVAMANLTMAFTTEQLIGMIYKAANDDWPSGLAYKVIESLFKKYVPQDLVSKIELRRALSAISMKKDEDPEVLFEAISALENKYNTAVYRIPDEEKIATILEKAPAEYTSLLTSEQRAKGNALTMEDLLSAMNQLYRTMHSNVDSSNTKEVTLAGFGGKIVCYRCKEEGHKAFQCPNSSGGSRNSQNKKKFKGKCRRCDKEGHKEADCWENPDNAHKAPKWFGKRKNNKEETGMVSTCVEVLLMGYDEMVMAQMDDEKIQNRDELEQYHDAVS